MSTMWSILIIRYPGLLAFPTYSLEIGEEPLPANWTGNNNLGSRFMCLSPHSRNECIMSKDECWRKHTPRDSPEQLRTCRLLAHKGLRDKAASHHK
ncbi:hypothetical protein BJY04DRAFT_188410 [Aspergillus karnatakaensis]|uniref:uncharacterized protein n=1 Tax=Aspergillus karnatakaensis TaxID=1810916 RepID=UPI003CCDFCCE